MPLVLLLEVALLVIAAALYVNKTRTTERQAGEIAVLRAENIRLRQERARAGERQKEAERKRLLAISRLPIDRMGAAPPIETEPNGSIERVIRLKSYYARHPERSIPDMRLLTDDEWIQQAKAADLETELGNRKALYMLRQYAQQDSAQIVVEALKAFMAANPGKLPSDSMQLVPYLKRPEDADYLALYQRNDEAPPPAAENRAPPEPVWVFNEIPQMDPWFPFTLSVGQNGERRMSSVSSPAFTVEEAAAKYFKTAGTRPANASQLVPYLKTPVPTPLLEEIFQGIKKSPH